MTKAKLNKVIIIKLSNKLQIMIMIIPRVEIKHLQEMTYNHLKMIKESLWRNLSQKGNPSLKKNPSLNRNKKKWLINQIMVHVCGTRFWKL